jgi:LCP family protein required for cell wall assembly
MRILAALLSLAVLVTSGVAWASYRQFTASIRHVDAIPPRSAQPSHDIDGKAHNILIVGNDDRSTATDAELAELGTTRDGGSLNTDTMMLLHVPANGKKAAAISFPRDSLVTIPGFGDGKLNAAYSDGLNANNGSKSAGAQLLVRTIEGLTGLTIDSYVQVDLIGFYKISNALNGVTVCLKAPMGPAPAYGVEGDGYDSGFEPDGSFVSSYTGINLHAGNNTIKGLQALAFVRQRHGLPRGDLDRIVRQQYFLSAVFRKVTSAHTLTNLPELQRLMKAVSSSLTIDGVDLFQLAEQLQNLSAGNVVLTQVPTTSQTIDGTSYQVIDHAGMRAQITALITGSAATTAPTTHPTVSATSGTSAAPKPVPAASDPNARTAADATCIN